MVISTTEEAVWDHEFIEEREEAAEQLLEEYEALAADLGVSIRTELAHCSPSQAIIGAADDFDANYIVGSRDRTGNRPCTTGQRRRNRCEANTRLGRDRSPERWTMQSALGSDYQFN
ncbi:universal stress protein [Natronococcus wangiae]|uniref:universal stress protein n=1 Tax=Natronococcus wangiae TaxID=3068275 RepID=UPI00273E5F7B|nr:universal stress protein [Natronococcus sp. AD5]